MSSRLMPPKVGSSAAITSISLSRFFSLTSMSNTSMPANFLNSTPLPSITGLAASGVAEGVRRVGSDLLAGRGHAGRVGEREVVLVDELLGRVDRDLAGRRKLVIVEGGTAQLGAALI